MIMKFNLLKFIIIFLFGILLTSCAEDGSEIGNPLHPGDSLDTVILIKIKNIH